MVGAAQVHLCPPHKLEPRRQRQPHRKQFGRMHMAIGNPADRLPWQTRRAEPAANDDAMRISYCREDGILGCNGLPSRTVAGDAARPSRRRQPKGSSGEVRHFADHIIAERGVRYGRVVMIPTAAEKKRRARRHSHKHD
jgi:hypothetical protein